jgi:hypothetical protein
MATGMQFMNGSRQGFHFGCVILLTLFFFMSAFAFSFLPCHFRTMKRQKDGIMPWNLM